MKEKLLTIHKKDFKIQAFQSGGPGGQHQNRVNSGVRIIHKASGAVGESRNDKSQHRNKRMALARLVKTAKFKMWINRRMMEITTGKTIDERVEESLQPKNLKVETRDENNRWIAI